MVTEAEADTENAVDDADIPDNAAAVVHITVIVERPIKISNIHLKIGYFVQARGNFIRPW